MPATKIRAVFHRLQVNRLAGFWGPDEWTLQVVVDGAAGTPPPACKVDVRSGQTVDLEGDYCAVLLDLTANKPGDKVTVSLRVRAAGVFSDSDLGAASLTMTLPFPGPQETTIDGPPKGKKKESYFAVHLRVETLEQASTGATPAQTLYLARRADGTTGFNSVSAVRLVPCVELCPVVPVPTHNKAWKRNVFPSSLSAGVKFARGQEVPLVAPLALNALVNPSLIPILDPKDEDFATKAARIGVTYLRPGNLDRAKFFWKVKSGAVKIQGAHQGVDEIVVYGTAKPDAADELAELELRWINDAGPVLGLFRAWVGPIKKVHYRATIFVGQDPSAQPRATSDDVRTHLVLAKVLLWQSGLELVPDLSPMGWDGAAPEFSITDRADEKRGIFSCSVADGVTLAIPRNAPPVPTRLNFRPGVMHLAYIKSFDKTGLAGVATDRAKLSGADSSMGGTPSVSWVSPTGVAPEAAAGTVTMKTMPKSDARTAQADKDYLSKTRGLPANAYDGHFAVTLPDYTAPDDADWPQTVAHEIGHVLGLLHRGNPGTDPANGQLGSADGVNDPDGKGHPFKENVMSYGYTLSQDLDLLQTKVIRAHPTTQRPVGKKHVVVTRAEKSVPHFCQAVAPWKDLKLGQDRTKKKQDGTEVVIPAKSIASAGCAITSVAMVLAYFGRDVDPQSMDEHLDAHDGYAGDSVKFGEALRCKQPEKGSRISIGKDEREAKEFGRLIDAEFALNRPVIAQVDYESDDDGDGNHFIVLVGRTADGLTIMNDPASGSGNGAKDPKDDNILELTSRKKGYNLVRVLTFAIS